ncbi:flagellar basal body rod protein FlgG [Marinococcus luteus]|uniref:flagellar basal body rod protein FlgG n=1 Tax=Marinococcus luteus TaxID=1122204 RepID=UPI002ACCCB5F|nr:flagellar basal body rod protein FlgG [Marinococcus luteus]MDZ5781815.1 flagellar basal body rod protein FlgG [Marinococcus luteus]
MLRSMYSGIAGMKNFQQKLDVISNNISNVNTQGFKKGRPTFQDMMSQQTGSAAAAEGGRGGVNAKQVGLGSEMGSIDTVDTQGSLQNTGRELDLAISGSGYFRLQNPTEEGESFTRAGNFYLDDNGDMVNSEGLYVLDTEGDVINIDEEARSFSIDAAGNVNIVNQNEDTETVAQLGVATFANPGGLEKSGGNVYRASLNSGAPNNLEPGQGGAGEVVAGALEMSNVDLSEEFTEMITAQRGFQANTRGITTADEVLQELLNIKR